MAAKYINDLATRIFGDAAKAAAWLETPLPTLNGKSPSELLETIDGAERIAAILRKIQFGEFS